MSSPINALSALHTIAIAASVGVAAIADDMVAVLLGAKWQAGAPLVPWLTVAAALLGFSYTNNMLLIVLGKAKWVAIRSWLFLTALVIAMLIGQHYAGLIGVALGRGIVSLLLYLGMQIVVCRLLAIGFWEIIDLLWRPLVAAAAMFMAIHYGDIGKNLNVSEATIRLAINVAMGGFVFLSVQVFLWLMARRPHGIESYVASLVKERLIKKSR